MNNKPQNVFKVGLFIVALFWFSFTFYQLAEILFTGVEVPFTDIPATVGLGVRTVASLIALGVTTAYLIKSLSPGRVVNAFRWVVLFEAVYWLLFLPSGVWGFQYSSPQYSREFFILSTGLPCTVGAVAIPVILIALFLKINVKNSVHRNFRWGLIAASVYLFVFWFNYTAQWWSEIFVSGTSLIWQSRLYSFEFIITVCGLLLLTFYTIIYAVNSQHINTLTMRNLQKVGVIITAFGLYFNIILLLWLLFPNAGSALTIWPIASVEHNPDLWLASLPSIGIPLLFQKTKDK